MFIYTLFIYFLILICDENKYDFIYKMNLNKFLQKWLESETSISIPPAILLFARGGG